MLSVLAGVIVVREIYMNCGDSAVSSWIYLLEIRRADIDPRTTPIYRRYKIFRRLRLAVAIGATVETVLLTASLFVSVLFWIDEAVCDALQLFLIICCGWLFRIHNSDFGGRYAYVGETGGSTEGTQATDLIPFIASEIALGGSPWQQGMWLPAEPAQTSAHHGRIKLRDRADSIDLAIGEDLSLGD
jgi:hypothetical protein